MLTGSFDISSSRNEWNSSRPRAFVKQDSSSCVHRLLRKGLVCGSHTNHTRYSYSTHSNTPLDYSAITWTKAETAFRGRMITRQLTIWSNNQRIVITNGKGRVMINSLLSQYPNVLHFSLQSKVPNRSSDFWNFIQFVRTFWTWVFLLLVWREHRNRWQYYVMRAVVTLFGLYCL